MEKQPDETAIKLMSSIVQTLARHEITKAMKAGTLPIEVGMGDLFFKGVCFGIAIAAKEIGHATEKQTKQESVKKN